MRHTAPRNLHSWRSASIGSTAAARRAGRNAARTPIASRTAIVNTKVSGSVWLDPVEERRADPPRGERERQPDGYTEPDQQQAVAQNHPIDPGWPRATTD